MLKTYRKCHKAYNYKYEQNLQKKKKDASLLRGSCVHEMIEAKANGKDPWETFESYVEKNKPLFTEQDPEYENLVDMITTIMEGYFSYYKNDPLKPIVLNGKAAEHPFSVELDKDVVLTGVIDMIVEDPKLGIGIEDHKTHKVIPTGDIAYSNIQSALYAWAMTQLDEFPNPQFMVWNYIRWKEPTKPKLLKSGKMSTSLGDTTWRVYRRALIEANLDLKDYEEVRQQLEGRESEFFVRQYLPINKTIMNNIKEDALSTAHQIMSSKLKDRNITRDCSYCEFYPLCQAELKGLDSEMVKQCEYTERAAK